MIYGVGTDILEISRIKMLLNKYGDRFARKILGQEEMCKYLICKAKVKERSIRFLAGRFAVKEALFKANKASAIQMPITWHTVQTLSSIHGKPVVIYSKLLKIWIEKNKLITHVSIAHDAEYVIAFVILENLTI